MKCPKCKNTITRLVLTRVSYQYVYVLDNGKIETSPPDVKSPIALKCQWCAEDIIDANGELEEVLSKAMGQ